MDQGRVHDAYTIKYDLTNCDAEPLHLIRSFQSPASLLVFSVETRTILAISDSEGMFWGDRAKSLIGQSTTDVLPVDMLERVVHSLDSPDLASQNPLVFPELRSEQFPHGTNLILHRKDDLLYLEFEPMERSISSSSFLYKVDKALQHIQSIQEETALYDSVVREVRKLTGFDRVMLYRFDEHYNGDVIGEDHKPGMPSYLNLRYPHTDIPKQARDLYFKNQIRHVSSTRAEDSVAIHYHPELGQLDLTMAANRGTSPIHLKYLNNIGVGASLSIAIIVDQQLWGLVACHHETPRLIDFRLRSMLGFMMKVMSGHLALWQSSAFRKDVLGTSIIRSRMFERMNEHYDILKGLLHSEEDLLGLTRASGAVILLDQEQYMVGQTPSEENVLQLVEWLGEQESTLYASHQLFKDFPPAKDFTNPPAGLISIRLTDTPGEYVLWFRSEIVTTVNWGGRPDSRKQILNGRVDLHPEMSFQKYAQSISGLAEEWEQYHVSAALTLRSDIKEVILQKYKQVSRLNGQLMSAYEELESFSYTVSHDLRAPLRNIKGFAEILQEDYFESMDDYGQSALMTIVNSVGKMNQFINDILSFSRIGRTKLVVSSIDLDQLMEDLWTELTLSDQRNPVLNVELNHPSVFGDYVQIRQVFLNLVSNALKYASAERTPVIRVESNLVDDMIEISVTDNGIGFDMRYADRIFAVFNRLVSEDSYSGTGVGLAITKRVVDKHHGQIEVWSAPNEGARFTVSLPVEPPKQEEEEDIADPIKL